MNNSFHDAHMVSITFRIRGYNSIIHHESLDYAGHQTLVSTPFKYDERRPDRLPWHFDDPDAVCISDLAQGHVILDERVFDEFVGLFVERKRSSHIRAACHGFVELDL